MAVGTIAHGKAGTVTWESTESKSAPTEGIYSENAFNVSYTLTAPEHDVTTFDTAEDFTDAFPGNLTMTGSFDVYVNTTERLGNEDLLWDWTNADGYARLYITDGATWLGDANGLVGTKVLCTGIDLSQDPNGVPVYTFSFKSSGEVLMNADTT